MDHRVVFNQEVDPALRREHAVALSHDAIRLRDRLEDMSATHQIELSVLERERVRVSHVKSDPISIGSTAKARALHMLRLEFDTDDLRGRIVLREARRKLTGTTPHIQDALGLAVASQ
jgi:hypothetical protein